MSTIVYRRLDSNNDPIRGQGLNDFLTDADAVAQAIMTRLNLWQAEWWENLNDGLPMIQDILGYGAGKDAIDLLIQSRILGTPYVTGMTTFSSSITNRAYQFSCQVTTAFGAVAVSNQGAI